MRRTSSRFIPLEPLAGSLFLMLAPAVAGHAGESAVAVPGSGVIGMTITVKNCNDAGPGSLRNAVARALSGDTIDMSGLACNAITLTSGAIVIRQKNLSLQGPGRGRLTVKGSQDRVFDHLGSGLLRLKEFSLANGYGADGGCIHAQGHVELQRVRVHHCRAGGSSEVAGGGIYAVGNVSLYDSAVEFNRATSATPNQFGASAVGGGIYSLGRLSIERSHICDNVAEAGSSRYSPGVGGGAHASAGVTAHRANIYDNTSSEGGGGLDVGSRENVLITNSTIARNASERGPGGIWVHNGDGTVTIRNSTFSENTGGNYVGLDDGAPMGSALDVAGADVATITNSTIAFNRNISYRMDLCGGAVHGYSASGELRLMSTIVANNVCDDTAGVVEPLDIRVASIEGSHNLIHAATSAVPADTITANPLLAPLAANGGPTKTHALPAASPAVDAGANPHHLHYDQRGPGFPRMKGPRADIGAYER